MKFKWPPIKPAEYEAEDPTVENGIVIKLEENEIKQTKQNKVKDEDVTK